MSRELIRTNLSQEFAAALESYQQTHRLLMETLHDDTVDSRQFERLSEQLHADVNALKNTRIEMKRQLPAAAGSEKDRRARARGMRRAVRGSSPHADDNQTWELQ